LRPRRTAAPREPPTTQLLSWSAFTISSRLVTADFLFREVPEEEEEEEDDGESPGEEDEEEEEDDAEEDGYSE
jgi:hypothetical protein